MWGGVCVCVCVYVCVYVCVCVGVCVYVCVCVCVCECVCVCVYKLNKYQMMNAKSSLFQWTLQPLVRNVTDKYYISLGCNPCSAMVATSTFSFPMFWFVLVSLFYGISTFVGYLMPKPLW